jgi:N-dimethylarginine dimethylaminohydrolase
MDQIHAYHQILKYIPPSPSPAFEDPQMLDRVWGRRWGVTNHTDPLKMVLVHRPGEELRVIKKECYDPEIGAIIDKKEGRFYFRSSEAPDIPLMQRQHDKMVSVLRGEGVEVVYVREPNPSLPKTQFTRDPIFAVHGGAILGRMATVMRRGEEFPVFKTIAGLGMPVLRAIHGCGTFEGGSFLFLTDKVVAVGLSQRQNEEGARQVEEVLKTQGIQMIRVPLTGFTNHLDECMMILDHDRALINVTVLPFWFITMLREMKFKLFDCHPDEPHSVNGLVIRPGKILLPEGTDRTAELLQNEGIDVVQVDISEIRKNGGGIHCSTSELIRQA